ncbi:MAG TPA: type I restriction enzyme HsdR N-terminal domain-containing protein [Crocinitomicaceae bacterium]|nr:type I restriction enzyme HsdR N-terminal domain-containing protein [Crocinitomicaceae bacterium]
MIVPLDFPKANLRLKRKNNQVYVWCTIRKMDLLCTPEEWVRQHVIHYLIHQKNISQGLIASEYSIDYNGILKRADIVVFNRDHKPMMIVECKAPEVAINEKVMFQIAQYNAKLDVEYLFLTNGLKHLICQVKNGELIVLEEVPEWVK